MEKIIQKLKERLQYGEELYAPYGYINPEKFGLKKAIEIILGEGEEDMQPVIENFEPKTERTRERLNPHQGDG